MDTSNMATEEPQQVQIDMSAFMDVIYTYKCKFCPFTCASSEEMSSHAMSTHVPENVRLQAVGSTDQEKTDTSNITSHDNQSTIIAVEEQESVAVVQETQTEESTDHHQYTEEQVEQNEIIADSEAVASQSEGVQSTASDGGDLRELFLCGQCCNVGFTSIEECRAHMLQEHDIHPSAAELKTEHVETEAPAEVAVSSNMVSVGTQSIIHKKPGRKRKSEIREEPEPDDKDSEEAEFNMDAPISIFNMRDTEGTDKRRVKPPKALMEDYYLGRRKHKKRRQPREPYDIKCKVSGCHAKFKTEDSKIIHFSCHLDIKDQKPGQNFKCLKCDSYFLNWKLTAKHLWKEHSIDADLFKCFHCEFRAETLQRLETHEQVHSDQKPYVCKTCGKGFKQLAQLKNHEVIHTTKKVNSAVGVEKWFNSKVCNICDKTFANQKCMKKHVEAVHDKLKPFKCQFCGHTTARKAMLLLHIRTHTGEKPYKCDLCTYVTGDHNTLRRHRMRHTGQKPYKCQICPYSCIQAISLKTHLKNKHPGCEGIFACELCQYHTVSQLNWEQHQADHRTGAIPDGYSSKREKTVASTTVAVSAQAVNTIANAKSLQSVLSLATGVGTQVLYYDPVTQQISAGGVPNQENTIVMADEATKQLMASSATPVTEASAQEETTIIEQAPGGSYTVSTGQEHEVLLTVQGDPHIEQTTTILPEGSIIYTQEPEQEGQQTFTIKEHHVLGQGDQMVTSGSEGAGLQHILTAIQNMSQEETVAIEGSTVEQTDGTALEIATEEVDESVNQDQLIEIEIK